MAQALQDGNLVWQKVKVALADANPGIAEAFGDLKKYLAQQKGNPQLQFIPFSAAQITTNLGHTVDNDASKLYGFYVKGARTSGTTASFVSVHAAVDNSASTTTVVTARLNATGQAHAFINPIGVAVETELTVSAATTVGGATESAAADAGNGFVIIGGA